MSHDASSLSASVQDRRQRCPQPKDRRVHPRPRRWRPAHQGAGPVRSADARSSRTGHAAGGRRPGRLGGRTRARSAGLIAPGDVDERSIAEAAVERAIATKFGVPHPWSDEVKYLDNCILHDEKAQLMRPEPAPWHLPGEPLGVRVEGWSPERARTEFMSAFHAYCEM